MASLGKDSIFFFFCVLIVFLLEAIQNSSGAEWSYDDHHGDTGPSNWKKIAPACGNASQSPIDIVLSKAIYSSELNSITFEGYNEIPNSISYLLFNNGHTVQLSVFGANLSIREGGLPGGYKLVQFHVHWGGTNDVGSEHKINGKFYPLEIHFVHFSTRFNDIGEALSDPQGLAVVGVFAEIGEKNSALDGLISKFGQVKYKGYNTSDIKAFRMGDLLPTKTYEFIRYNGSLTTPKCQESVIWTVLKNPIKISKTQLNAFRTLSHGSANDVDTPLENNYRPVQKIGSRTVLRTFAIEATPVTVKPKTTSTGTKIPSDALRLVFICSAIVFSFRLALF